MKSFVVILAGGRGLRMGGQTPKQYLEIDGLPVLFYAVNNFEKNDRINGIVIVCDPKYKDYISTMCESHHLSKVIDLVPGGETGHDSARNGVLSLLDKASPDDLVIIHDGARPIVPQRVINQMIDVAIERGNACSSIPMNETIVITDDQLSGTDEVDRSRVRRVQTPQAYKFSLISELYKKADADNIHDFVYANTMALHYGVRLYFSQGFSNNLKITRPEDLALFRALKTLSEEELY